MSTICLLAQELAEGGPLAAHLCRDGHELRVIDPWEGLDAARAADLVIMDLDQTERDGVRLAHVLRESDPFLPLVVMGKRCDETDILSAFAAGADDFVGKPCNPRIVAARVRALLRRAGCTEPVRHGPLSIDPLRRTAHLGDRRLSLTRTEFDVLLVLARHPGIAWSRHRLLSAVWGDGADVGPRIVDVRVSALRKELCDDRRHPTYIETVFGIGYRFREA
jgi:two-component system alkaline phosphatase synthesis response regulator PhoP